MEQSPRAEQRKFRRVELGASVGLRVREGGREIGTIDNLSVGGCAITAPGYYPVGATLFVTMTNFQPLAARVVWQRDGQIGVEFDIPLHPAVA
ncbi:MAG: PilZ domain-containing protein, partial [Sphingomonas sp.]